MGRHRPRDAQDMNSVLSPELWPQSGTRIQARTAPGGDRLRNHRRNVKFSEETYW